MLIHDGILCLSDNGYAVILLFGIIIMIIVIGVITHKLEAAVFLDMIFMVWIVASVFITQNQPTSKITKPAITTTVNYVSDPRQFNQTTTNQNTNGSHTIVYHHSLPHARRHGIYLVAKQYHHVYKNKFDKKYLNTDDDSIGKKYTPYKTYKYYYVPKDIPTTQSQKQQETKCRPLL